MVGSLTRSHVATSLIGPINHTFAPPGFVTVTPAGVEARLTVTVWNALASITKYKSASEGLIISRTSTFCLSTVKLVVLIVKSKSNTAGRLNFGPGSLSSVTVNVLVL